MIEPPALSEEERRLLREYRISKVPPRRPSPQITPNQLLESSNSSSIIGEGNAHQNHNNNTNKQQNHQYQEHATQVQPQQLPLQRSQSQQRQTNQHDSYRNDSNSSGHHNNKHHGRHHHHHHHRRKHKTSTTPTHELTEDELSKMLELASGVSYLGLDSPIKLTESDTTTTNNNININSKATETTATTNRASTKITTTSIATNTLSDRLYIFEKVDYIKKFARRKALRKLNKNNLKQKVDAIRAGNKK